jgi:protein QN1
MDQVIRRRHPNSLPALIYAANISSKTTTSTTSKHQALSDSSPKHSTIFLEQKIHKLDRQLSTKDEEWERKMRSLQQKHNTLQLQYEEQISALQEQLGALKVASRTPGNTHPHTTIQALEKELENVRITSQTHIDQLKTENETLKDRLTQERTNKEKTVKSKARKKPTRNKEDTEKTREDVVYKAGNEGLNLAETLKEKNKELTTLMDAYSKLEAERNQLLVEVGRQVGVGRDGVSELEERRYNPRHFTDTSHNLVEENEQLKQQVKTRHSQQILIIN